MTQLANGAQLPDCRHHRRSCLLFQCSRCAALHFEMSELKSLAIPDAFTVAADSRVSDFGCRSVERINVHLDMN
jgi:hypothetical protein